MYPSNIPLEDLKVVKQLQSHATSQNQNLSRPRNIPLEDLKVTQLQSLLREKGLPVSGRKAELIKRLNHVPVKSSQPTALEQMKTKQLQALLKQKGLPVSGRKVELVQRLKNGSIGGPKPKPWQHSIAKKDLKRALLNPASPIHKMSVVDIRNSDDRYKQYPNFEKYYKELKERVEAEKKQVQQDDIAAERHMKHNPRSTLNKRGYPHWDTHAAKSLLEVDIANKMHQKMKPSLLRDTRDEYKEFPVDVFAKRVNREVSKQMAAGFWAHKRNKRGMKKYLKEIAMRAQEE